jgi:branched-chain amino acid transport system ATP-binding protein
LLQIRGISVNYNRVVAIKDVSLSIEKGEVVALIGNNGAGKTTTLKTISGLKKPVSGEIWFKNKRIDRLSVHTITGMGIIHVPEGRKIFSKLTVKENLLMGAYLIKDKKIIENSMYHVFELFSVLKEKINQPGGLLSGGEQQMLAIGRALMSRPNLLLLDEPSLGLAPILVETIRESILKIKSRGIPILLVEQNVKVALELADRGYVMEAGMIVYQGKAAQLLEDEMIRKLYLGVA